MTGDVSTSNVLDDAGEMTARLFAPWAGVVWATALPLRLLQVQLLAIAIELGPDAGEYGDALRVLGLATAAAAVLAAWGRAVYVRACSLALRSAAVPGREALSVPPAALVGSPGTELEFAL